MCGRFTLATSSEQLVELLGLDETPSLVPRYNIAPTQQVPVCRIVADGAPRSLAQMRWGLVPPWADDLKIGNRMINARSETASGKPAYRAAFKQRRCLIPATGFFEWKKQSDGKQPYLFRRRDTAPFVFAGLWERWRDRGSGEVVETCTILTGEANDLVAPVHDRMPVILARTDFAFWLDPTNADIAALNELLGPRHTPEFECFTVSRELNSPAQDRADLIDPIEQSGS